MYTEISSGNYISEDTLTGKQMRLGEATHSFQQNLWHKALHIKSTVFQFHKLGVCFVYLSREINN